MSRISKFSVAFFGLVLFTQFASGADEIPPIKVEMHLAGSGVDHLTENNSDFVCEGGDWQFDWSGFVSGETSDSVALLGGEGMYYTREQDDTSSKRPSLTGKGIKCKQQLGETVTDAFEGHISGATDPNMDVQISFEESNQYISVTANDVAACSLKMPDTPPTELPVGFSISSSSVFGASETHFAPNFAFDLLDMELGFSKTWQLSADNFMPTGMMCAGQNMEGTLRVSFKTGDNDPEIQFDSCMHFAKGESRSVSAIGTPKGGTYQFKAEPGNMLDVVHKNPKSSSSDVSSNNPSHGNFIASYLLGNKRADKIVSSSVVELIGFDLPEGELEIGIMDAEGKSISPKIIPFKSNPSNAGDLIIFKADNPAPLSLATGTNNLTLQGVKPGQTTVRARTLCDKEFGPSLNVKVVQCDAETRSTLERRKARLKDRTNQISQQVQEIVNDDEFLRVENEITDDTINLAIKTAESIIGTLTLAQGKRFDAMQSAVKKGTASAKVIKETIKIANAEPAIGVASNIYEYYDTGMDILDGYEAARDLSDGNSSAENSYDSIAKGVLSALAFFAPEAAGLGKSYAEAGMASQKMGQNLGTMLGAAERLEELDQQFVNIRLEWKTVAKLLKACDQLPPDDEEDKPDLKHPSKQPDPVPVEVAEPDSEASPTEPVRTSESEEAGESEEVGDAIEDTKKSPSVGGSTSFCKKTDSSPGAIAAQIKNAREKIEELQKNLSQRALTVLEPEKWAAQLHATLAQGPEVALPQIPVLREALNKTVYEIAAAGDATVNDLVALEECEQILSEHALNLKSLKFDLGPGAVR